MVRVDEQELRPLMFFSQHWWEGRGQASGGWTKSPHRGPQPPVRWPMARPC